MNRKALIKNVGKKPSISALKERRSTLQIEHLRLVDEIFVLQHVIRRFKMQNEADFRKLLDLRTAVSEVLRSGLPRGKGWIDIEKLFENSLWCCLSILDSKENLQKIKRNGVNWALSKLKEELQEILNPSVMMTIDVVDVHAIAKIIDGFSSDISNINSKLNYSRYYSLLGLTCYVPGEKLYFHYINAKLQHHKIKKRIYDDSIINDEERWRFTEDSANNDDLSILLNTPSARPLLVSKNVEVFGGPGQTILVNGVQLENKLILCVPTNEVPNKIDDAIRELRDALRAEYANNRLAYANFDTENYRNSIFMTQFAQNPCLIEDWDQIQKHIIGLWSWDVTNQNCFSIEKASEEVANSLEEFKNQLGHGLPIYKDNTIHQYHLDANKIIGSRRSEKKSKPTKIDYFLTGDETILGEIKREHM